jgi:hypothetical protein
MAEQPPSPGASAQIFASPFTAAPAAAAASGAAPDVVPSASTRVGNPTVTPDQLKKLADYAVADGTLTREQADEALRNGDSAPEAAEPDVVLPAAYDLPPIVDEAGEFSAEGLQQVDGWLRTAQFEAGSGAAIAHEVAKCNARFATMSDVDKELDARAGRERLGKLWGAATEQNLQLVGQLLRELEQKSPGLVELLERTGAGNSPLLLVQLHHRAQALARRRDARG